jgi:hypothetical protein
MQQGKRTVFFVDAAHFVLGGFFATLWSLSRQWVKAPSGRQRLNVLAALNALIPIYVEDCALFFQCFSLEAA